LVNLVEVNVPSVGAVTFVQERAALQVLKLLPLKLGFLDRLSPEQVFLMVSHF